MRDAREIDADVARYVFGGAIAYLGGEPGIHRDADAEGWTSWSTVPKYSSTWDGARSVIERMRAHDWWFSATFRVERYPEPKWFVDFRHVTRPEIPVACANDADLPRAVALCALKARAPRAEQPSSPDAGGPR